MISLAYVVLQSKEMDDWLDFARTIGAEASRVGDEIRLRVDDRVYRVVVRHADNDDVACVGFDLNDASTFARILDALAQGGVAHELLTPAQCAARSVAACARVVDPEGLIVELTHGLARTDAPVAPVLRHGFAADDTGFGHVLLKVANLAACRTFYALLGATLSDQIVLDGDGSKGDIAFLHFNSRHHTIALMQGEMGSARRLQHFMIEMRDISDVGRTFDRLAASRFGVATTLGQHTNDRSISFYCKTPAKFWLEIGCMPVQIEDEAAWRPGVYHATSEWGHRLVPAT